jgi:glycosyltransferase involved in cell wall biosynthesis
MRRIVCTVTNDLNFDQRMHKICGSLTEADYQVSLVGRLRKNSAPLKDMGFRGIRLHCIFEKGKLFYIEYNIRLFFFLLFFPCDMMYAVDLDTIMPVLIAGKLRGKKLIYDAHEYFTEVPEVTNRPGVKQIWQWVERLSVPRMDLCITVGDSIAGLFRAQYKKDFHVIRNVPLLKDHNIEVQHEGFILYQGALNKGRGLEELIRSMQELPLRLLIAGEGDLSAELRTLVKDLGLERKVSFLGLLRPDELRELTPKAFLGYNLLENTGKSYYYSLSNKFFDYIHAGVPGLSSFFPEYVKLNREYEVGIMTNLSAAAIVLEVGKVLENPDYYIKLKANCAFARKELNWQMESRKLISLINAC